MEKWGFGTIVCIKEYKTLKPDRSYSVKGMGDLEFNCDEEADGKKGHGYCVEDEYHGSFSGDKNWWKLPHSKRIKWYYFTEDEMDEYFITSEQNVEIYLRDSKIDRILNI